MCVCVVGWGEGLRWGAAPGAGNPSAGEHCTGGPTALLACGNQCTAHAARMDTCLHPSTQASPARTSHCWTSADSCELRSEMPREARLSSWPEPLPAGNAPSARGRLPLPAVAAAAGSAPREAAATRCRMEPRFDAMKSRTGSLLPVPPPAPAPPAALGGPCRVARLPSELLPVPAAEVA